MGTPLPVEVDVPPLELLPPVLVAALLLFAVAVDLLVAVLVAVPVEPALVLLQSRP
jgi:hypothetical protein